MTLADTINAAMRQTCWPNVWKREVVTIIPKVQTPASLSETRNISCTPVFSKILEYFVLQQLREEVAIKNNQYGSTSGVGTNHYLAYAWTDILEKLDQDSSACCLLSVDFAKAFNTMCHFTCLKAIKEAGGSDHSIAMAAAFLTDKEMIFKVGDFKSSPRHLKGGAPQGTLMGNFLFILTTDYLDGPRLEEGDLGTSPVIVRDGNVPSTPVRPSDHPQCQSTPVNTRRVVNVNCTPARYDPDDSFSYVNPFRNPLNRINDTVDPEDDMPVNDSLRNELDPRRRTWKKLPQSKLKYVDDLMAIEHLPLTEGFNIFSTARTKLFLHASESEDFFDSVKYSAEEIGMRVNDGNTQLLCIAGKNCKEIDTYLYLSDGSKIEGQKSLKQLGFVFGRRPKKFRCHLWFLRHFKGAGVEDKDLVALYKCFLVTILDYASVVYHPMMTKMQAANLEGLQAAALKIIFGYCHMNPSSKKVAL